MAKFIKSTFLKLMIILLIIGKIIMMVMNAAPGRTNANSVSFFLKKYPLLLPIFPLHFTKRALLRALFFIR